MSNSTASTSTTFLARARSFLPSGTSNAVNKPSKSRNPRTGLLILGSPSSSPRWCLHLSETTVSVFVATLSDHPDEEDDLIPTGVVRNYARPSPRTEDMIEEEKMPVEQSTSLMATGKSPRLRVKAAAEMGSLRLNSGETASSLVARLLALTISALSAPPATIKPGFSNLQKDKAKDKDGTELLGRVFAGASAEAKKFRGRGEDCLVFIARVEEVAIAPVRLRTGSEILVDRNPLLSRNSDWGKPPPMLAVDDMGGKPKRNYLRRKSKTKDSVSHPSKPISSIDDPVPLAWDYYRRAPSVLDQPSLSPPRMQNVPESIRERSVSLDKSNSFDSHPPTDTDSTLVPSSTVGTDT